MRFSHRFFLYGPFLLLVALAGSVMVYWWIAATALSAKLDALNNRDIVPGVHMHFGAKRIAGFPFRLDIILRDLTLETRGAHGPLAWHTKDFAAHRLTYDSGKVLFEAAGPQDISWTGENGSRRTFRFTPGSLRADAIIGRDSLIRFDLVIAVLDSARFAAGNAQFHMRRDPASDALDLVLDLQSIRFAGDAAAGFANGLSRVRIEGRLAPGASFAGALKGETDWHRAVDAWRVAGGGFKADQAAVFWGRCEATSAGNLTLDDAHRLAGALNFTLTDCEGLPKEAAAITTAIRHHRPVLAVLNDLGLREPHDKSGAWPATVVFKDGILYLGPGKTLGANASYFEPLGTLHTLY